MLTLIIFVVNCYSRVIILVTSKTDKQDNNITPNCVFEILDALVINNHSESNRKIMYIRIDHREVNFILY